MLTKKAKNYIILYNTSNKIYDKETVNRFNNCHWNCYWIKLYPMPKQLKVFFIIYAVVEGGEDPIMFKII
jgi:hypothetical protein